jgi:hypothetical protein
MNANAAPALPQPRRLVRRSDVQVRGLNRALVAVGLALATWGERRSRRAAPNWSPDTGSGYDVYLRQRYESPQSPLI